MSFQEGDLVLRISTYSRPQSELKKLSPMWECPYVVTEVVGREPTDYLSLMESPSKILGMRYTLGNTTNKCICKDTKLLMKIFQVS